MDLDHKLFVVVCCSVLQCFVAVCCCSVLQCVVAVCCCSALLQCVVAVCCCSVLLQCVCSVLQHVVRTSNLEPNLNGSKPKVNPLMKNEKSCRFAKEL